MVKRFLLITTVISLFFCNTCYGADISAFSVRDTIYNKPEITEFIYGDSIDGVDVEAYLNDEKLTVSSIKKASELKIKTNYIFLADESTSISDLQIAKVREALSAAADNIEANETMTIVTFGEDIRVIADHSNDKEELKAAAASVDNTQGGTVFFDVIKRAGEISNAAVGERNIVIIISDGADFTVGGHNYEEVEKYVKDYGITIYAVALGNMNNPFISKFGQLARSSDGEIVTCTLDTIDDSVLTLLNKVRENYALVMQSKNNVVNGEKEKLIIKFTRGQDTISLEESIIPNNWVKDTTAPTVNSIKQVSDNSLLIEFSEDVLNGDNAGNYAAVLDGKHEMQVSSVSYDRDTHSASIVFDGGLYAGEYTIGFRNITDNSMEKNPLTVVFKCNCTGEDYSRIRAAADSGAGYWLLLPIIILIAAGIFAYVVINRRKGVIIHEKKLMFKDNLVDKERIITPETVSIFLLITTADGITKKLEMKMYKSLIVGRSDMCDLSFDDAALSRQHFAIEENNGFYTVMNLSDTNGTIVNGVPLTSKIKLENNDVIIAGNEKFVFKTEKVK